MMGRAQQLSDAIIRAVSDNEQTHQKRALAKILYFFSVSNVALTRYEAEAFAQLRNEFWELNDEEYRGSLTNNSLRPAGDLGYSGSTFLTTRDDRYLIKSIPRRSEYNFFAKELLHPYNEHMSQNPVSLLVRITDFLHAPRASLGTLLRITPAHHVIMENILHGRKSRHEQVTWETFDLKPSTYFYPERDLAGGNLASEATKDRLLDTFDDKIRVDAAQRDSLMVQLGNDTVLLQRHNIVDYSLFLVRYRPDESDARHETACPADSQWRSGVNTPDGKWTYRAVILDFFWAKHQPHAKAMTLLIRAFNVFGRQGHMSITTDPVDYRHRFLRMAEALFETEMSPFDDAADPVDDE